MSICVLTCRVHICHMSEFITSINLFSSLSPTIYNRLLFCSNPLFASIACSLHYRPSDLPFPLLRFLPDGAVCIRCSELACLTSTRTSHSDQSKWTSSISMSWTATVAPSLQYTSHEVLSALALSMLKALPSGSIFNFVSLCQLLCSHAKTSAITQPFLSHIVIEDARRCSLQGLWGKAQTTSHPLLLY